MEVKNPEIVWGKFVSHSKKVRKTKSLKAQIYPLKPQMGFPQIVGRPLGQRFSEVLWLTLFLFGLTQGYFFLTRSAYWTISDVRLYGVRTLSEEQLNRWAGPIQGQNIFKLNLPSLAQRLGKHPWVHWVSVERKFPNAIRIHIGERAPMARVRLDKVYVLDNFGVLLEEATPEFSYLPLIRGINVSRKVPGDWIAYKSLAPSLKIMHYLNQLEFFQNDPICEVKIKSFNRAVFTTQENHIQIRMNLENPRETFKNLKAVLGLDAFNETTYEYIDLSFRNQIVVKPTLSGNKVFHSS